MANVLILHGTGNTSAGNWFPWLSQELVKRGFEVWAPDLPQSSQPDEERYLNHIFSNKEWKFTPETIIVGHSSGGVAALRLLQRLPEDTVIDRCITVGAFTNTHGWDSILGLFRTPIDYGEIKKHAKKFIVYHSDDDPHVPIEDAKELQKALDAEFVFIPGQGHFNLEKGPQYGEFPALLEKILE